jgi:hypothetical protein
METSYGLRALGMRIFPGFSIGTGVVSDPEQFHAPPMVQKFFPNYLQVLFDPFPTLRVSGEYWVPESNLLTGRFELHNRSDRATRVEVRLYSLFKPSPGGQPMGEWHFKGVTTLAGRSNGINPILFLTGGARADQAIYPALVLHVDVPPDSTNTVFWVHAGFEDHVASFDAARAVVARQWDAEITKIELMNESCVDVETGNEAWDAALAFSQKTILGSFLGPTEKLPNPSFVLARTPDHGYSSTGDGSDYDWRWDGQNAAHAFLHLDQLLISAPNLATGLLRNFIATQRPDGIVNWKIGLAGQKNGGLSSPALATTAWRIYEHTHNTTFLEDVFQGLIDYLEVWFSDEHDRDGDGHPEWDHTLQMGFDECPSFVRWRDWGQGLDISYAETPDLASFLINEIKALGKIGRILDRSDDLSGFDERFKQLVSALQRSWSDEHSIYHHLDRDTHLSLPGESLGSDRGDFVLEIGKTFKKPVRLVLRSQIEEGAKHAIQIAIHGRGEQGRGRVERLKERDFRWFNTLGTATTERTYNDIDRVEVKGMSSHDKTEVLIADYTRSDISLFLPLLTGIPTNTQAENLISEHLLKPDRYWREFGIPGFPADDPAYEPAKQDGLNRVSFLWNAYIVEGLLNHGYREEAAALVTKLISAATKSILQGNAFREFYDPDEGVGYGERNPWFGSIPIGQFLKVLGVRLFSPTRIMLSGANPFPDPVTLRWKGLEIQFLKNKSRVIFPDGGEAEIEGEEQQLVEQVED